MRVTAPYRNDEYEQLLSLSRCVKPPNLSCITPLRGHAFWGFEWEKNVKIVGKVVGQKNLHAGDGSRSPSLLEDCSAPFPTHKTSDVGKRY